MKKTILTLFLIIAISGCTMPGALEQLMPGYTEQEVKELSPDVLTIKSLTVIPPPPINADDQFSVSFIIANLDEIKDVENTSYQLFDSGLCNHVSGNDPYNYFFGDFVPLEERFFEWTFNAPTNDDIAHLSTKCPIRFKVNYDMDSTSQIDLSVITDERLKELQRAGESISFIPTLTLGRGPLKVKISFGASMPIRASTKDKAIKLPIYLVIEDKGTGLYTKVPDGKLTLKIHSDFDRIGKDCDKFNYVTTSEGYSYYTNNDPISIIRKKSPQLKCSFNSSSNVDFEKTYYITAYLNYNYTITGETEVTINPTPT